MDRQQKGTCWHDREMRWRQRLNKKGAQSKKRGERHTKAEKRKGKNKKEHNGQSEIGRDDELAEMKGLSGKEERKQD